MLVVDERRAARDFLLAPSQFDNRPIKGALPFGGGSVVKAHKVSSPYLRPPRPGNPKAFALPEKAPFLRHGEPLRFVFRDALFPRPRRARLDAALASALPVKVTAAKIIIHEPWVQQVGGQDTDFKSTS